MVEETEKDRIFAEILKVYGKNGGIYCERDPTKCCRRVSRLINDIEKSLEEYYNKRLKLMEEKNGKKHNKLDRRRTKRNTSKCIYWREIT